MASIRLPDGTRTAPPQPFSRELLEKSLEELSSPEGGFTGFITIESAETIHLLFFFQGRPYAAGKASGDKASALTLREFFSEIGQLADTGATICTHASDPVLLKSLLILIQGNPTVKAPANLINLETVLHQIHQDAVEALVILENRQMYNLFYFKDGSRGMSYFSDTEFHDADGMPFDEQMLLYAFQPETQVNALVYRTTATHEAADALLVSRDEMLSLLRGEYGGESLPEEDLPVMESVIAEGRLELEILNGPLKGETIDGPIPGVIGRKDADILIQDPLVSKRHAAVQVVNGRLMLVDLNSTNGTTLNGVHVVQHELSEGDVIGLGETALKVLRLTPP